MAKRRKRQGAKWMQSAVKRPGALTRKARAAGESTAEFAESHRNTPGRTGKQARLALIFRKANRGKKKAAKKTAHRRTRRRMKR